MSEKSRSSLATMAFGSNASAQEAGSALVFGGIGVLLAVGFALWADAGFEWWQWVVVVLVAFDLIGGVAANATLASTYQYHRPDEPIRPLVFASGHVHPVALTLVIPSFSWQAALAVYLCALVGTALVVAVPSPIKRAIGLGYCAVAMSLFQFIAIPTELAWLAPAFLLKLVAGHAVPMWDLATPRKK